MTKRCILSSGTRKELGHYIWYLKKEKQNVYCKMNRDKNQCKGSLKTEGVVSNRATKIRKTK